MARKSTPQPLTLPDPTVVDDEQDFIDSPRSPLSPKSPKSPRSPFRFNTKKTQSEQPHMQAAELQTRATIPTSQTNFSLNAILPYSGDSEFGGQESQENQRPSRSGFFSNYKASKSSSRLQNSDTARQAPEDSMSRDTDRPSMSGKVSTKETARTESSTERANVITRRPVGGPSQSDAPLDDQTEPPPSSSTATLKKNKPKPFSLLSRTKSIRDESSPRETSPKDKPMDPERTHAYSQSVKTAPIQSDRSFRDMMGSSVRQHSADRVSTKKRDMSAGREQKESKLREKEQKENGRTQTMREQKDSSKQQAFSSSFREGSGHTFLNNLKSSATKGAGALSKGLFGKGGRSGSTTEKEGVVDDEHYELKVINLPLVQQTRLTRIAKKLEDSRDKTEFWMPAFPWRAIDYLNYKGSDVEGLYRVPGSGPQIKKWQRRFDEQLDIDLFEQDDLYDINIIGSMLKAWLRELPDELLPKAAQDRIARECADQETVPQLLIDELSNLSPFNYYLLFAITCHLSLLLAHSEKNKMDFRNLCICFQPCMKIDAFCFKFLVCDWRDCWKGCKTEAQYIEQEYMLFDMINAPSGAVGGAPATVQNPMYFDQTEGRSSTAIESNDERNVSSSDSSKPSTVSIDNANAKSGGNQHKKLPLSQSQGSMGTVSTTLTVVQERTPPRRSNDMRPLSPIKPLSPIGF